VIVLDKAQVVFFDSREKFGELGSEDFTKDMSETLSIDCVVTVPHIGEIK